jgi:hypothetical protein
MIVVPYFIKMNDPLFSSVIFIVGEHGFALEKVGVLSHYRIHCMIKIKMCANPTGSTHTSSL